MPITNHTQSMAPIMPSPHATSASSSRQGKIAHALSSTANSPNVLASDLRGIDYPADFKWEGFDPDTYLGSTDVDAFGELCQCTAVYRNAKGMIERKNINVVYLPIPGEVSMVSGDPLLHPLLRTSSYSPLLEGDVIVASKTVSGARRYAENQGYTDYTLAEINCFGVRTVSVVENALHNSTTLEQTIGLRLGRIHELIAQNGFEQADLISRGDDAIHVNFSDIDKAKIKHPIEIYLSSSNQPLLAKLTAKLR